MKQEDSGACKCCVFFLPGNGLCCAFDDFGRRRCSPTKDYNWCEKYRCVDGSPAFYCYDDLKRSCDGAKYTGFDKGE